MILILIVLSLFTTTLNASESLSKQLPQAIIIGVKKCGTRALIKFLSTHSSIVASANEVHFFDRTNFYQRGLQWYREQMPVQILGQSLTIEKTPHYFVDRSTPARLAQSLPKTKLIIILRDPIVRAISDYVQLKSHHSIYPTFDQLIASNNFTRWTPIRIGCYARYLRRWFNYFPRQQIHFVDGENLIRRPWEELEQVQQFLNISQQLGEEKFYFNSKKFFFPCLRQPNGCLGIDKGRRHPSISSQTRAKLKEFYSKCNHSLKELAQIDFSWIE